MNLTSEIKEFTNFSIQQKDKLSGIENFIKIKDNEIESNIETITSSKNGKNSRILDRIIDKKGIANKITSLSDKDLKIRLEKLKDFLVENFTNNIK